VVAIVLTVLSFYSISFLVVTIRIKLECKDYLLSSGICWIVVWWSVPDISEEHYASSFKTLKMEIAHSSEISVMI
jgi:hypothetical protein